MPDTTFRDQLQDLINYHSMENGSDTPDFILADYLTKCLEAFDVALTERLAWYNKPNEKEGE